METTQAKGYQPASWRGATPYHADTDRMGVCFDLPDGQVIRLAISRESAAHLVGSIMDYLPAIGVNPLVPVPEAALVLPAAIANALGGSPKECKLTICAFDKDTIAEAFERHREDFALLLRQGLRGVREGEVDAALKDVEQGPQAAENFAGTIGTDSGGAGDLKNGSLDDGPISDSGGGEFDDDGHARR